LLAHTALQGKGNRSARHAGENCTASLSIGPSQGRRGGEKRKIANKNVHERPI